MSGTVKFSREEKRFLLVTFTIYFLYTLYHVYTFLPFVDEVSTFLDYTSKGFAKSISTYEEPNNHVFFSILTNLTYHFPFDSLINLRIINVIIGIVCFWVSYSILRKHFTVITSLIAHTGFVFSFFYTYYSVFARGYMLLILFVVLSFYYIEKILHQISFRRSAMFVVITSLGFLTIPTYLYFAFSLFIYLLILNRDNKKLLFHWVLLFGLSGVLTILFYFPILFNEGLSAITNNKWTAKLNYQELLYYFNANITGIYDNILGIKSIYIYIIYFGLLMGFFVFSRNSRKITSLILILFITPICMLWILKVIPGPRVWSYLTFPFYFGLGFLIDYFITLFSLNIDRIKIILIGLVMGGNIFIFNKNVSGFALSLDKESKEIADYCLRKSYDTVQVYGPYKSYEELFLKFQYMRNSKKLKIIKNINSNSEYPIIISNSYINKNRNFTSKEIEFQTPHILLLH